MGVRFKVTDWRAWAPGLETLQAWRDWAGVEGAPSAVTWSGGRLPPLMQRRIGVLGQKAVSAALGCSAVAGGRYVLASRHGELGRTVGLLRTLAGPDALSPTDFSMSVHHALAGLLSIHTGNREGHTAVAAGADTFGFGFLEAASYVAAESKSAMLIFCDDPLPVEYDELESPDETLPLVVVVQFEPVSDREPHCLFSLTPSGPLQPRDAMETGKTPRDFLRFLLGDDPVVQSEGQRMDWRWQRVH